MMSKYNVHHGTTMKRVSTVQRMATQKKYTSPSIKCKRDTCLWNTVIVLESISTLTNLTSLKWIESAESEMFVFIVNAQHTVGEQKHPS